MWTAIITDKKTNTTTIFENIRSHCAEKLSYYKNPADLLRHVETIHHITTADRKALDFSSDSYHVSIQY